jgi:predicted MFS family arabinose efflux permease
MSKQQSMPMSVTAGLYDLLTADEDARACREIPDEACQAQPENFLIHLVSSSATKIADELASAKLVLAWLLATLGAPAALVALLVPVRESGALLPQLAVAGYLRRAPIRKWFWVAGSLAQGLAVIGMGLVTVTLQGAAAGWTIIVLLAIFSLARGVCSVAHKDVLGKTIDKHRRGTVMGYAGAIAGVATVAAGALIALWRGAQVGPGLFLALLGMAGLLWILGALVFATLREQPGATEGGANALTEALHSLGLLRRDADFRHFVITRTLLLSTALSLPYYVLLAQNQATHAGGLGVLMVASGLAASISAPVWGRLSDRSSRGTLVASAVLAAAAGVIVFVLTAWEGPAGAGFYLLAGLFLIVNVAHSGVRLGRKTYLIDLATEKTRAAYVAVSNTLIGLLLLLGSLFGLLAEALGPRYVVLVLALIALGAAASAWRLPEVE